MWNKKQLASAFERAKTAPQQLLGLKLAGINNEAVRREYLGTDYFARALMFAVILHVLAFYIWHISPKTQVVDIPVRALNIKLGDMDVDAQPQLSFNQVENGNSKAVESTISKLVEGVKLREDDIKPVEPSADAQKKALAKQQESAPDKPAQPRQFVRSSMQAVPATKVVEGNSTASDAEIMRRYEQVISLWIKKFKIYPDEAKAQNLEGETVVRIRIDRQGNVKYYRLERSTGFQVLDHAAIAMIKRANPVPAVPHDYPPGDQMEFLIPVNFNLK